MSEKIKKPINSRLPEEIIQRWYLFALQTKQTKENALAEIMKKGLKKQ